MVQCSQEAQDKRRDIENLRSAGWQCLEKTQEGQQFENVEDEHFRWVGNIHVGAFVHVIWIMMVWKGNNASYVVDCILQ